jgi:hypothetical protein
MVGWFMDFNATFNNISAVSWRPALLVEETSLSTIFQLYHSGQFYWWRKSKYPENTTDLSQVTV